MQVNVSVDLREQNASREQRVSAYWSYVANYCDVIYESSSEMNIWSFFNVLLVPDLEELCLFSTGTYSVQLDSTFSIFY